VDVLLAEHVQGIANYLDAVARYRFGAPYVIADEQSEESGPVIRLERDWQLGEEIGRGGFGRVILARAGDQQAVAKFVPKEPGARRELLFVDLGSARNVVPVIDHGETEDSWVLVMPRAEMSLRQHLDEKGPSLPAEKVRVILTDVTTTLVDLAGKVVHRDIKPENVLLLDGHWCLADFGISRYAEATTAPDTHKFAMSPPYAAPERWRSERATGAADVYAVGVMGYEMLTGGLPFPGPAIEDFRDQHLHTDPRSIDTDVGASMASVIDACLIKAPGARPQPADMLAQLGRAAGPPALPGLARLQEASRTQSGKAAAAARRASEADTEEQRRADLFIAASQSLQRMMDEVAEAIKAAAPASRGDRGRGDDWSFRLGHAQLRVFPPTQCNALAAGERIPFDVVACTDVELSVPPDTYGYEGRSHALWFCDAQEAGRYSWFETAFMIQPLMAGQANRDPFSLRPGAEAAEAIGPGVGAYQVAWPFTKLDDASLEAFTGRWAGWFAEAADGHLHRPSLPEGTTQGSWRRN
jgi:serine/threonine-protein kinase